MRHGTASHHAEYLRAGTEFYIYCWKNNISIAHSNSKKYKTFVCPSYTFKLNSSYSFRTSDDQINHISKEDLHMEIKSSIIADVAEVHLVNYQAAHDVLHQQSIYIDKLLNQVDNIGKEINATVINGNAITWKHLAFTGLSGSSFLIIILFIMFLYQKCKDKISFPTLQIFREAANIRQEVRETVASEISNNMELVQSQVKRQLEDNFNAIIARNFAVMDQPMNESRRNRTRRSISNYRFREI